MKFFSKTLLMFALAFPCLAFGAQNAVLRNGFSITHERHAVIGTNTRLYTSADGSYVDVPTDQIDHFEAITASTTSVNPSSPEAPIVKAQLPMAKADLNGVVNEVSTRHAIDPDLINSVIHAESDFKVHAVSNKGAQGLMQLMPQTATQLGVANAFDPRSNVEGGTRYLRGLLEKYNFDLAKALAAYNAGPLRVEQYGGIPPYYETRAYVARIIRDYNRKKLAEMQAARSRKNASAHATTRPSKPPLLADSNQQTTARQNARATQ